MLHQECQPLILRVVSSPRDLAADLAAEIQAAIAESSRAVAAPPPISTGGGEDNARAALRKSEAHLTPTIPDSAPLSGAKRLSVRLLRFLWRDQSSFNALMIEAINELAGAVAGQRGSVAGLKAELVRHDEKIQKWVAEVERWREESERRLAIEYGRLAALGTVARGPTSPAAPPAAPAPIPPGVYSLFEERFRGTPESIDRKQRFYLRFLRPLPGPVLDAGCGRGEFLSMLAAEGISGSGIDVNPIAVAECRSRGLDASEGDALANLAGRPAGGLGAVVAFQVVEHWTPENIFAFLCLARRAMASGGVLIVETINSNSLSALKAFFLDPSHVRPVPPEALQFLVEAAGFADARIEYRGELPASERLVETTENDRLLNRLLFAPQDYAVIARVPTPANGKRETGNDVR